MAETMEKNYAIIASGGKQYRVSEGDVIKVESLHNDEETVYFDKVLMLSKGGQTSVGTPYLQNHQVEGKILSQGRSRKIHGIKFKRRKGYLRQYGHRQNYTQVEITRIG